MLRRVIFDIATVNALSVMKQHKSESYTCPKAIAIITEVKIGFTQLVQCSTTMSKLHLTYLTASGNNPGEDHG